MGQKYQIPIWFWYFLGIPNFWFPIDITIQHTYSTTGLGQKDGGPFSPSGKYVLPHFPYTNREKVGVYIVQYLILRKIGWLGIIFAIYHFARRIVTPSFDFGTSQSISSPSHWFWIVAVFFENNTLVWRNPPQFYMGHVIDNEHSISTMLKILPKSNALCRLYDPSQTVVRFLIEACNLFRTAAPIQNQWEGDQINGDTPKSNEKVSIRRAKRWFSRTKNF